MIKEDQEEIHLIVKVDDQNYELLLSQLEHHSKYKIDRIEVVDYKLSQVDQVDGKVLIIDIPFINEKHLTSITDIVSELPNLPIIAILPESDTDLASSLLSAGVQECLTRDRIEQTNIISAIQLAISRKNFNDKLIQENTRNRKIMETIQAVIIVLSSTGEIISFNNYGEKLTGYQERELVGKYVWDMLIPPESINKVKKIFSELIELGEPNQYLNYWIDKYGNKILLSWSNSVVKNANDTIEFVIGTAIDITDIAHAKYQYYESERRYNYLIEEAPIGVIIERKGIITLANMKACRIFGYSDPGELIGEKMIILMPKSIAEDLISYAKKRMAGEFVDEDYETLGLTKSGEIIPIMISAKVIDFMGEPSIISFFSDLSERKKMEEELKIREEELIHSQKMEAVGRLAGGIAHDINNMLTVISGYSELIRSTVAEDSQIFDFIGEIITASQHSASLVDQLLIFSRKKPSSYGLVDINEIIRQSTSMVKRIIGEDIGIEHELSDGIKEIIADPTQLLQVIINLVMNSKEAMPSGGKIRIKTMECDTIFPEISDDTIKGITLIVEDTGKGIEDNILNHIFEPFFTTKSYGSGLGLSIVYGIIKQLNGIIEVESVVNEGTIFIIKIPVQNDGVPVIKEDERIVGGLHDQKLQNYNILVVEDDLMVQNFVKRVLVEQGCQVMVANDAYTGYEIVHTKKDLDLIISDIILPGMNGLDFIKNLEDINRSKVLFITGYSEMPVHKGIHEKGYSILEKPFKPDELVTAVKSLLKNSD